MKNEVRPIDANAAIEALRANFQQGSWYGCEEPGYQIAEDTISEMPTLTDHFPDPTKMIPLTLEQLRKMRGKWVWLVISGEDGVTGWAFVSGHEISTFFGYDSDKHVVKATFSFEENGKEFFAYAYPPAHIDREAWTAEWTVDEFGHKCSKCGEYLPSEDGDIIPQFCPSCGRATTAEGLEELEKRMGVRV